MGALIGVQHKEALFLLFDHLVEPAGQAVFQFVGKSALYFSLAQCAGERPADSPAVCAAVRAIAAYGIRRGTHTERSGISLFRHLHRPDEVVVEFGEMVLAQPFQLRADPLAVFLEAAHVHPLAGIR